MSLYFLKKYKLIIFNTGKISIEQSKIWKAVNGAVKLFTAVEMFLVKLEKSRYQYIMKERHTVIMNACSLF